MNSDFMRWLLNVDAIPKGSESLRLAWEQPWPAWVWALLVLAAAGLALWSYSRLVGHSAGRAILAGSRALLVILILVLISGPMLELPRETVEQDWLVMLADRSASMTISDAPPVTTPEGLNTNARISRDEQLRQALQSQSNILGEIAGQKNVVWLGFHSGAFNLKQEAAPPDPDVAHTVPDLGEAIGARTNIEAALQQALQRAAARPLSGIVLFSDGRTDSPPSRALVRRLQADAVPVYVVPLGSPDPLGDLAIRRVESPRRAFVRDKVPIVVEIAGRGFDARQGGERATVKLIDQSTGAILDEQALDLAGLVPTENLDASVSITLTAQPDLAGESTWVAVIDTAEPDLVPENNARPFDIELIDRPLRVLYVEGYPRWEYRYLKNLLVRETSIESSVMLISADRDFAQEGNQPISRLPRSPEEFAQFDVIILGDVPASFFSPPQLEMMRAHVADRGAGLLWIGGERSTPGTFAGTALADLLPMRGSLALGPINETITMRRTPLAERLGVLQLEGSPAQRPASGAAGWPAELTDPATGWSQLFFAQRIDPAQLKPAAEVLAETVNSYGGSSLPLVISMRYGAGLSIYVATDEIWRWRYGRGEHLPEQFWVQIVRTLGRESVISGGEPAILEVNPRRVVVNQPMRIELRLLDSQLTQSQRSTVRVVLENEQGQRIGELDLQRVEGADDRFAATWLADSPGELRVRVDDSTMPMVRVAAPAEIFAPDDELQRPQTDHELLASLAAATGGRVLRPDELHELANLPNRAVRTMNPLTEPIWDSPLALILALLALTGEWVGRKVLRLA